MAPSTRGTFQSTGAFPASRQGPNSWSARSTPALVAWSGRLVLEGVLATLSSALIYALLLSEIQVDDVALYAATLRADRYEWSVLHLLMQPAALFWHHLFGRGGDVIASMEQINLLGAAIGIGIFHVLLCRLGTALPLRLLTTALAVFSFNFLALAPTAHIKLVVLPALMLALYWLCLWERQRALGKEGMGRLLAGSVALGVATATLLSIFAAVPFLALAVLAVARRAGSSWSSALGQAVLFGALASLVATAFFSIGYLASAKGPVSVGGFVHYVIGAVTTKQAGSPRFISYADTLARSVYSIFYNFVFTPVLGPVSRAWMLGQIDSLAPYWAGLLRDVLAFLVTVAVVSATYLIAVLRLTRTNAVVVAVPLAFAAGALAFAITHNLNDPEHWFQFTGPTLVLFAGLPWPGLALATGTIWFSTILIANLGLYAIPRATFPLAAHEREMQQRFGANDLIVLFSTYPGRPDLGLFDLGTLPQLRLDLFYRFKHRDKATFFPAARREIDQALHRGGRVVVFRILDERDWDAPWMYFLREGITKAEMLKFFRENYDVRPAGSIAGFEAWELTLPAQRKAA